MKPTALPVSPDGKMPPNQGSGGMRPASIVAIADVRPTTETVGSIVAIADVRSTTETVGERVHRLQAEAKQLAKDHVRSLVGMLIEAEHIAAEIAEGGDAYPPGVRDLARRLVQDTEARVHTLEALIARTL